MIYQIRNIANSISLCSQNSISSNWSLSIKAITNKSTNEIIILTNFELMPIRLTVVPKKITAITKTQNKQKRNYS